MDYMELITRKREKLNMVVDNTETGKGNLKSSTGSDTASNREKRSERKSGRKRKSALGEIRSGMGNERKLWI